MCKGEGGVCIDLGHDLLFVAPLLEFNHILLVIRILDLVDSVTVRFRRAVL